MVDIVEWATEVLQLFEIHQVVVFLIVNTVCLQMIIFLYLGLINGLLIKIDLILFIRWKFEQIDKVIGHIIQIEVWHRFDYALAVAA